MHLRPDGDRPPRDRVGLCATCAFSQRVASARGSVFRLCRRALTDARFPKYPRLPVLRCAGFEPTEPGDDSQEDARP